MLFSSRPPAREWDEKKKCVMDLLRLLGEDGEDVDSKDSGRESNREETGRENSGEGPRHTLR